MSDFKNWRNIITWLVGTHGVFQEGDSAVKGSCIRALDCNEWALEKMDGISFIYRYLHQRVLEIEEDFKNFSCEIGNQVFLFSSGFILLLSFRFLIIFMITVI